MSNVFKVLLIVFVIIIAGSLVWIFQSKNLSSLEMYVGMGTTRNETVPPFNQPSVALQVDKTFTLNNSFMDGNLFELDATTFQPSNVQEEYDVDEIPTVKLTFHNARSVTISQALYNTQENNVLVASTLGDELLTTFYGNEQGEVTVFLIGTNRVPLERLATLSTNAYVLTLPTVTPIYEGYTTYLFGFMASQQDESTDVTFESSLQLTEKVGVVEEVQTIEDGIIENL